MIQIKEYPAAAHKFSITVGFMSDTFLSWQEGYAVGHPGLDGEHRRLVELINEIAALGAGTTTLQELSSRSNAFYLASVEHFRHENSVMRDIIAGAYLFVDHHARQLAAMSESAVNNHCAEHARALIKLEGMIQRVPAGDCGPALASELKRWFLDHAINHDAPLKDVFQTRQARSGEGTDHRPQQTPASLQRSVW